VWSQAAAAQAASSKILRSAGNADWFTVGVIWAFTDTDAERRPSRELATNSV
jgi:hypothetical protein